MKKSMEPRWNQTFIYSPVHQREFRDRMLELTVWDQARVREEESQFLGEVRGTPCLPELLEPQMLEQFQELLELLNLLNLQNCQ